MAKSSKSHPTDSDDGVRSSESGVGRLRGFASKPSPPLTLSVFRPLSRHRNQVGDQPYGVKNKAHVAGTYLSLSYSLPPAAAPRFRTLVRRGKRGCKWRRVRHGVAQRLRSCAPRAAPRGASSRGERRAEDFGTFGPKSTGKTLFLFPAFRWRKAGKKRTWKTAVSKDTHIGAKNQLPGQEKNAAPAGEQNKKSGRLFQVVRCGSGGRTRTSDLRVMSPTSCQLLYPAMYR